MDKKLHITIEMPSTVEITSPSAEHLPDDKKVYRVDVAALAQHDAAIRYIFEYGLGRTFRDAGAVTKEEEPDPAKRALLAHSRAVERIESLSRGELPRGGGGARLDPVIEEVRKIALVAFKSQGFAAPKVTDIKAEANVKDTAAVYMAAKFKAADLKPTKEKVEQAASDVASQWLDAARSNVKARQAMDVDVSAYV